VATVLCDNKQAPMVVLGMPIAWVFVTTSSVYGGMNYAGCTLGVDQGTYIAYPGWLLRNTRAMTLCLCPRVVGLSSWIVS